MDENEVSKMSLYENGVKLLCSLNLDEKRIQIAMIEDENPGRGEGRMPFFKFI